MRMWKVSLIALTMLGAGCEDFEGIETFENVGRVADLSVTKQQDIDGCQLDLDMRNRTNKTIKPRLDYAILARTGVVLKKGLLAFGEMTKKGRKIKNIYLPGVRCGDVQKFFVAKAINELIEPNIQGHFLPSIDDKAYRW